MAKPWKRLNPQRVVEYHGKKEKMDNALANLAPIDFSTGATESAIGFARKAQAL